MSSFTFNHHHTPILRPFDFFEQILNGTILFLNVNIAQTNLVKVLNFVVGFFNSSEYSITEVKDKRHKPKSKAAGFHLAEGGAVPTMTHQIIRERLENYGKRT